MGSAYDSPVTTMRGAARSISRMFSIVSRVLCARAFSRLVRSLATNIWTLECTPSSSEGVA